MSKFEPKHFHAYNQIPTGAIYRDLISYYYSKTIQLQFQFFYQGV